MVVHCIRDCVKVAEEHAWAECYAAIERERFPRFSVRVQERLAESSITQSAVSHRQSSAVDIELHGSRRGRRHPCVARSLGDGEAS